MSRVVTCLRVIAVAAAVIPGACHRAPRLTSTPIVVNDFTGVFARVHDATGSMPTEQRVAVAKPQLLELPADFYGAMQTAIGAQRLEDRLRASLESFPSIRSRYQLIARDFPSMLPGAWRSFKAVFADALLPRVYLLHSLGDLDGGLRTLNGEAALVFGADVMAANHRFSDQRPFVHHELFHAYHRQFFRDCAGMWCNLWREGLAVHVAQMLNPAAGDDALMLTQPQPLRASVDRDRRPAVCAVAANLDSTNNAPFFSSGVSMAGLPPRFGYYVGYLVAIEASRATPAAALARLPASQARPLVDSALARLATCPR